jgi:uncharacterized protein
VMWLVSEKTNRCLLEVLHRVSVDCMEADSFCRNYEFIVAYISPLN